MRLFVAIDFDEQIKVKMLELQKHLKPFCLSARWKSQENFHLTLKFLGEVERERIDEIKTSLKKISEMNGTLSLDLNGIGCFDNRGNEVRVLWTGVEGEVAKLRKLAEQIDNEMERLGFDRRRHYSPHITLAEDIVIKDSFDELSKHFSDWKVEGIGIGSFVLMSSEQIEGNRVYTPIGVFNLGKN